MNSPGLSSRIGTPCASRGSAQHTSHHVLKPVDRGRPHSAQCESAITKPPGALWTRRARRADNPRESDNPHIRSLHTPGNLLHTRNKSPRHTRRTSDSAQTNHASPDSSDTSNQPTRPGEAARIRGCRAGRRAFVLSYVQACDRREHRSPAVAFHRCVAQDRCN